MSARLRHAIREHDLGDGFYAKAVQIGSCTWYYAEQLDEEGGFVVNGRKVECFSMRNAKAQIAQWRAADRAALARRQP